MSEGDVRPFREPCDNSSLCGLGPLWQHGKYGEVTSTGTNSTLVTNWVGTLPDIPPYERFTRDESGGDSCEVHHCTEDSGGAPCSQWLRPYPTNTFASNGTNTDFSVCHKTGFKAVQARRYWNGRFGYLNRESGNGPDTTECCDGVNTFAKWRSYTSAVNGTKYLTLTVSAESQEEQFSPTTQVNWDDTASYSESIDPTSGLLTISDFTVSPNDDRNRALGELFRGGWFWSDIVADMVRNLRSPFADGDISCTDTSTTVTAGVGSGGAIVPIEVVTWDLGGGNFERFLYSYDGSGTQLVDDHYVVTVTDSTLHYRHDFFTYTGSTMATSAFIDVTATLGGENTSASIYSDVTENLLSLWPMNDDALYPWRTDLKVGTGPLVSRDEILTQNFVDGLWVKDYGSPIVDPGGATIGDPTWTGHCGLVASPDPNTGTRVSVIDLNVTSGDIVSAAADGFSFTTVSSYAVSGTLPPGVSFDSSTGIISGTATVTGRYGVTVTVTGAAAAATGSILGAPLTAGYQNFFDFGYLDWNGCCFRPPDNPGFQTWSWYQQGWGMNVGTFNSNTGCSLPLNATQWPNYFQSANKPQGAWLFYNEPGQAFYGSDCVSSDAPSGVMDGDALWACKYAEILEVWPSQNFARPAGDDKFIYDENHVVCVVNVSGSGTGSTWAATDPVSGVAPADDFDFSGNWGGASVNGFFDVTSYSSGTLTLGTKVYDVPSNWTSKSHSDGDKCFGKLRYPTYPALLGRAAVTVDTTGSNFTFVTPQPAFGMTTASHQEQIDIYNTAMTVLASNVTATRVDDSTFTTTGSYATAAWVTIHGSPAWYMNDNRPKGDYLFLQWLADLRSIGEWNRLNGVTDCSGSQVSQPSTNVGGGPVTQPFASFSQTQSCLPFGRCEPRVVCITPNGETFSNGVTHSFPESFACDELYGSKWWGYVQNTMTDLFWQQPHRPCNIESCAKWQMDGGFCLDDVPGLCPGDDDYVSDEETPPPTFYYGSAPVVEARISVPDNYGMGQDESGPAVPGDVQLGWLSPVDNSTGDVVLPPLAPAPEDGENGRPGSVNTCWFLHELFCTRAPGCRFDYGLPACPPT